PNFPDDLFEYLFGVPEAQWESLRDSATMIVPNCSSLGTHSTGLIWVTGDCAPGGDIGSEENPVALVVQDSSVRINGNVTVNGLVFSFLTPGSVATPELKLNGGANIQGAVMSNYNPSLSNGTLMVRYNEEVLTNIVTNDEFRRIFRVGGSWRDF